MQKILQKLRYDYLGQIPKNRPYIFCVGLSKTGTTSLNDALDILGHSAVHLPPMTKVTPQGEIKMDWPWWLSKHDAATDLSVAAVFEELVVEFPNARFIYTTRDIDKWLDSCRRHFTHELAARRVTQRNFHLLELSQAFYGSFLYDEALYRAAYEAHDRAVRARFEGAANFMEYDITAGQGWGPLCQFLGHPVPDQPFPMSNVNRKTD